MKKNENFSVVNLTREEVPIVTEDLRTRYSWIPVGIHGQDDYFDLLTEAYNTSTTNAACIEGVADLIYGKGLTTKDEGFKNIPRDRWYLAGLTYAGLTDQRDWVGILLWLYEVHMPLPLCTFTTILWLESLLGPGTGYVQFLIVGLALQWPLFPQNRHFLSGSLLELFLELLSRNRWLCEMVLTLPRQVFSENKKTNNPETIAPKG